MRKVYIASPYSIGDKDENVRAQIEVANELMDLGFVPFVPLLFHFQNKLMPRAEKDWLELDLEWLKSCDCVLRLDGESKGADAEVEQAEFLNMNVYNSVDELMMNINGF